MTDKQMRVAMIVKDNFEQSEMEQTRERLQAADVVVDLVGVKPGHVQGLNHIDKGDSFPIDKLLDEISPDDYDAVVLPGGAVNADGLRVSKAAQDFVTTMDEAKKPVAAICHAAWLLVSAGLLKGRTLTSYPTIRDDLENAGATWVDQPVNVDGNLITSRNPNDIPAFSAAILAALAHRA